jgi:endonuclease YncB( thermonuclease family)
MGCFTSTIETIEERERKLLNITLKETKQFSFEGLIVNAKIVDVYDGDTFRAAFYYKDQIIQSSCRCLGYDSPEMKVSMTNPDRENLKQFACKARDRFKDLVNSSTTGLVKLKFSKNDMYGRPLTEIYIGDKYINKIMIDEGYGKPYDGGHKNVWTIADAVKKNV